MNAWVQVDKLQDAEPVNAQTLNRPVDQLASRTDYLKRRLGTIMDDGYQSALILTDVDLIQDADSPMAVGNVVYRDTDGFRKAQAKMHLYDDFTADNSAFTIGILINSTGDKGDVLIYGKLDLGETVNLLKANMLQDGETFRSGRYYLSAIEAGKLTANPSGPLIYVGDFHDSENHENVFSGDSVAYINPQFLDIGTSHVHRAYAIVARPAGDVVDGDVIGYLPIGAKTGDSDSSTSSSPEVGRRYPSLIFSGTWTSTPDIDYVFTLSGNEWGNIKLQWTKNGDTGSYSYVDIPAPDVFVDLDNGLKVKVLFPEATNKVAYEGLSEAELTWNLRFPTDGKGWVNHSVEAVAENITPSTKSTKSVGTKTPAIRAVFSGAWPDNDNTVYCLFPAKVYEKDVPTLSDLDTPIVIGSTTYIFVASGDSTSSSDGSVIVEKAGTVEESLHNLAVKANSSSDTATVFVNKNTLVSCDLAIEDATRETTGIPTSGFKVIGGIMKAMVAYDVNYYMLGDIVKDQSTYLPIAFGNLSVRVYAQDATIASGENYVCKPGTRLRALAYDYEPKAVYDYVMGLHQEVDYYFPPVPAQAAGLFVNGIEMENAALFENNPTYLVGRKTLHWLEDDEERRPWPEVISSHNDPVDPALDKTMVFYFVVGFQCATGPVTSLVPAPGSAVKLYTYGTNDEAYTGDLMIDADLDLTVADAGVQGYNVAKQGKNGKLLAGPVVERVKAGSGIVIMEEAGCPVGQGTVTISLDNGSTRGQFGEIALENAKQEKLGLFPYVSLLGWGSSNNIPSAFTTMMRVPSNLDADKDYQLQLRLVMFGTIGYSGESRARAAGIQMEYNILPDYTDTNNLSLKTGLIVPDNPRVIAVPLGHQNGTSWEYVAYDPFVATTDTAMLSEKGASDICVPFSTLPIPSSVEFTTPKTLKPGYLVAIRLSRITMADTVSYTPYTGPLGFLSLEWTLQEV